VSAGLHTDPAAAAFSAVAVASSSGGLHALSVVLGGLPAEFPIPVLVVQHGGGRGCVELLGRRSALPVTLAQIGQTPAGHGVTVVPPHLELGVSSQASELRFTDAPPTMRPADHLCATMAARLGPRLITVVLTGRLDDAARGARATKRAGGRVLVQDPGSAAAPGMPSATLATGCVDFVLPLERVAVALISLVMAPGGADLLAVPTPSWAAYA